MSIETWVMMITTIVTVASGYAMLSRSLRKEFDKRFDENDRWFDGIEATLARMDNKFTEQFNDLNKRFDSVNTRIDQVNSRIDDGLRVSNR